MMCQTHSWASLIAGPGDGVRAQSHGRCAHAGMRRPAWQVLPKPTSLNSAGSGGFQASSTHQTMLRRPTEYLLQEHHGLVRVFICMRAGNLGTFQPEPFGTDETTCGT